MSSSFYSYQCNIIRNRDLVIMDLMVKQSTDDSVIPLPGDEVSYDSSFKVLREWEDSSL